ncbi:MAG: hypothetical protein NT028_10090 [candidate division Zixibacteria bacterium]|nr:hypothetical protein [candidate division Zixibacteria bacterium]
MGYLGSTIKILERRSRECAAFAFYSRLLTDDLLESAITRSLELIQPYVLNHIDSRGIDPEKPTKVVDPQLTKNHLDLFENALLDLCMELPYSQGILDRLGTSHNQSKSLGTFSQRLSEEQLQDAQNRCFSEIRQRIVEFAYEEEIDLNDSPETVPPTISKCYCAVFQEYCVNQLIVLACGSSILRLLDKRGREYSLYQSAKTEYGDLDADELVQQSLLNFRKHLADFIVLNGIDPEREVSEVPEELYRYFYKILENNRNKLYRRITWKRLKEQGLESLDQADSASLVRSDPRQFMKELRERVPPLVRDLDFELAFYFYVINKKLSPYQRIVTEAWLKNDEEMISEAKKIVGFSNYYVMRHRLFELKQYHKIAIKAGEELLGNGQYKDLPGGTKREIAFVLKTLRAQIA